MWGACASTSTPCCRLPRGGCGRSLRELVSCSCCSAWLLSGVTPACACLKTPSCPLQASQRWGRTWWWLAGRRTWACPSPCCCIRMAGTSAQEVGAWWPQSLCARQLRKKALSLPCWPLWAPKPVSGVPWGLWPITWAVVKADGLTLHMVL